MYIYCIIYTHAQVHKYSGKKLRVTIFYLYNTNCRKFRFLSENKIVLLYRVQ